MLIDRKPDALRCLLLSYTPNPRTRRRRAHHLLATRPADPVLVRVEQLQEVQCKCRAPYAAFVIYAVQQRHGKVQDVPCADGGWAWRGLDSESHDRCPGPVPPFFPSCSSSVTCLNKRCTPSVAAPGPCVLIVYRGAKVTRLSARTRRVSAVRTARALTTALTNGAILFSNGTDAFTQWRTLSSSARQLPEETPPLIRTNRP